MPLRARDWSPATPAARAPNDRCIAQYQSRVSGPFLDRMDLQIELPAVSAPTSSCPPPAEGSAEVAARVAAARKRQTDRYAALGLPGVRTNAACPAAAA